MRRTTLSVLSALAILLSGMIVPEAAAQSRRDKEQTYVLEKPYEVKKLVPPTGKKIKNVILMIGDDKDIGCFAYFRQSQSLRVSNGYRAIP